MKRKSITSIILALAMALIPLTLSACIVSAVETPASAAVAPVTDSGASLAPESTAPAPSMEAAKIAPGNDSEESAPIINGADENPANMVDERFELLSLVFRLAGHEEYGDDSTEYQKKLASEFGGYKNHAAVKYAQTLPLAFDAVFKFSVHIEKRGEEFVFIEDIGSLVDDDRWTRKSAAEFLPLLNDFYVESDFAAFYQSNIEFYKAETRTFIDGGNADIDMEWFREYVAPENLRCVYTPSSSYMNYGATVNETIVYCAVSGTGTASVHEYCHSFANPIAHTWYTENAEFKRWCDETIDPDKLPSYGTGKTIAGEYVTRAYNTLYYAEHGHAVLPLLYAEKGEGFPYIEDVYAMITPYEKPDLGDDLIGGILGVGYTMGEEQTYDLRGNIIKWRVLSLEGPLKYEYYPTTVGNIYESNTGDVLYVEDPREDNPVLYIDLGETTFQGMDGFRSYSLIPLG